MTRDEYIKLHKQTIAAIDLVQKHGAENCVIECSDRIHGDCWYMCDSDLSFDARHYRARLKPQKRVVPWSSLDEVPLTHWFRLKAGNGWHPISDVDPHDSESPVFLRSYWRSLGEIFEWYEHSAPCDDYRNLIWLPCGKEVVE